MYMVITKWTINAEKDERKQCEKRERKPEGGVTVLANRIVLRINR